MQKIEIVLDEIELSQLDAYSRLNNVSIEEAASVLIASHLSESVNKALDDMLLEAGPSTPKNTH